jgi:hypothetical protein
MSEIPATLGMEFHLQGNKLWILVEPWNEILKWIFKKQEVRVWTWFRARSSEQSNVSAGSIKGDVLTSWATVSFSKIILLRGVNIAN